MSGWRVRDYGDDADVPCEPAPWLLDPVTGLVLPLATAGQRQKTPELAIELDALVRDTFTQPGLGRLWEAAAARAHVFDGEGLIDPALVKRFDAFDHVLARRLIAEYGEIVARALVVHAATWWSHEATSWVDGGPYWTRNWGEVPSFAEIYRRRVWWAGHLHSQGHWSERQAWSTKPHGAGSWERPWEALAAAQGEAEDAAAA